MLVGKSAIGFTLLSETMWESPPGSDLPIKVPISLTPTTPLRVPCTKKLVQHSTHRLLVDNNRSIFDSKLNGLTVETTMTQGLVSTGSTLKCFVEAEMLVT